jgi:hypothetical protein
MLPPLLLSISPLIRCFCISQRLTLRAGILSLAWATVSGLMAQEVARESFDYPPDVRLSTTEAAPGWSSGWKADQELTQVLDEEICGIIDPGLEHPALEARGVKQRGGALFVTKGPADIYRGLEAPIDWRTPSVLYLRALVRWEGNHETGASRVLLRFDSNSTFVGLQGDNENKNIMHLAVRNWRKDGRGEQPCPAGPVYLLVARLESSPAGEDVISASIFDENRPLPETEPEEWDVSVANARSDQSSTFCINTHVYAKDRTVSVDEVVMADSYESLFGE